MAKRSHPLLQILAIFLLTTAASASRHHPKRSTKSTLDITSSLAAANAAVSSSLKTPEDYDSSLSAVTGSVSAVSLRLHSRDFISSVTHPDYSSLLLSRLRRDATRVASITSRAALALENIPHSALKPLGDNSVFTASEIEGPVVSGTSQGSGEYFSRVGIGSPVRKMYMVLDTGSDVTWVQCSPCADCYQQSDPLYDPLRSNTYAPVSCASSRCRALDVSACRNSTEGDSGRCLYQVNYGDGSYTVGDFATETMSLGASDPVPNVALGCGHDNEGLFVGAAGLLALGGGQLSFPSQIAARSFSYCLVDRDSPSASTLELETNAGTETPAVSAPLMRNPKLETFYYVMMSGISVGGELLSIPPDTFSVSESGHGGVIVDSGTAVTRLQSEAYAKLRDAFKKGTESLPAADAVSIFDTCYDLSAMTSVEVPTVALHFPEGKELRLPAKNYLIPVDGQGTYCLAFAPTSAPLSIIGNVQQQGTRVTFDLYNSVVGFTPNKC